MENRPEELVMINLNLETSSPIGMLFDHGADALTGVLFGLQLVKVFAVKS
jgi:hypothetical protein